MTSSRPAQSEIAEIERTSDLLSCIRTGTRFEMFLLYNAMALRAVVRSKNISKDEALDDLWEKSVATWINFAK